MLRTARPLLTSPARGLMIRRGPVCPPKALATLASAQERVRRANGPRKLGATISMLPSVWRTEYSTKPPVQPTSIDKQREKELSQEKLQARPEDVSSQSTVRHAFETPQAGPAEHDLKRDVEADLNAIKETVALSAVPREPYILGLAGTIPYAITSLSTLYLSWDLSTDWPTTSNLLNSLMMSHKSAQQWLELLEPVQLGYGAVIISFLGALHWGMEFAEKAPLRERTRFRYAVGVLAPAIAWPTLLMPVHWALTGQFIAFTFMYFVDSRAASKGWTPPWYSTYRFVLTFIVGSAIFLSLIGRAKIGRERPPMGHERMLEAMHSPGPQVEPYKGKWPKLEEEEKERNRKAKEEEEKKEKEEQKKKKGDEKGEEGNKGKDEGSEGKKDDKSGEDKKDESK